MLIITTTRQIIMGLFFFLEAKRGSRIAIHLYYLVSEAAIAILEHGIIYCIHWFCFFLALLAR